MAIYWLTSLTAQALYPLSKSVKDIECCILGVILKHDFALRICCVYRPPSTKLPEWVIAFCNLLDELSTDGTSLLIVGDFNINLFQDNCFADRLKADYRHSLLIFEPTRITKKSATLIDYIYISQKYLNCICKVAELHLSDHSSTFCELSDFLNINHKKFAYYR